MDNIASADMWQALGTLVIRLLAAVLVLVIGYIVSKWIAGLVRKLLGKTNLDNRFDGWAGDDGHVPKVESHYIQYRVLHTHAVCSGRLFPSAGTGSHYCTTQCVLERHICIPA